MARSENNAGAGLLWLRVLMGLSIASHGYGIIFGGRMDRFTQGVEQLGFPVPVVFAWAAALSQFVGGLCVVLGLFTRQAAVLIFTTMTVAVFLQHQLDPFARKELAMAYWTIAGALALTGPGALSLDAGRSTRRQKR